VGDNEVITEEKAGEGKWLRSLKRLYHAKAILSLSTNNHSILNGTSKQSAGEIMYVYGGLTRVSPRRNDQFVKRGLF